MGAVALALAEFLALYNHISGSLRNELAIATVLGVTAASAFASAGRQRRERELAGLRVVAEVAQRVLLRPVPQVVGPLRTAMRYVSATAEARIGGDLYEIVTTPVAVRLIVGDVQGKGLQAVETAATVVGAFREAAYDAFDLAAVAARLEAALERTVGAEEFVTAVLVEIRPETEMIEMLNCGHPPPMMVGAGTACYLEPDTYELPLGLGTFANGIRNSHKVSFPARHRILLYTDGITEARDRAGRFFPLAERSRMLAESDLEQALGGLYADVLRHVGNVPADDAAMLLIQRRDLDQPGDARTQRT